MTDLQVSSGPLLKGLTCGVILLAVLLGGFQAWSYRHSFYMQDAISYLDIADAYSRGDFSTAISSYWSPLYSWLIVVAFPILHARPETEAASMKILNFFIWLVSLYAFSFFIGRFLEFFDCLIRPTLEQNDKLVLSSDLMKLFLWIVFVCQTLSLCGVYMDTPDLLSCASLYVSSGLLLRLVHHPDLRGGALFGLILGVGFYAKSVLFPLGLVYLGTLWLCLRLSRDESVQHKATSTATTALLCFCLISVPFVGVISAKAGRLTIGDSGRMNYAHFVSKCIPFLQPNQAGTMLSGCKHLKHPPALLLKDPQVFEFAEPIGGCFPPWLDSSYWYDGFEIVFDPTAQFVATVASISVFVRWFFFQALCGWAVIAMIARQRVYSMTSLFRCAPILVPSLAALTAYAFVSNNNLLYSSRYFPAYFVLLYAGNLGSLELSRERKSLRAVIVGSASTALLFSLMLFAELKDNLQHGVHSTNVDFNIAKALRSQGILPGDRVADVDALRRYYWAHLAGVKIVVEILDTDAYWQRYAINKDKLNYELGRLNVKAIVARGSSSYFSSHQLPRGWQRLSDTDACIYRLWIDRPAASM